MKKLREHFHTAIQDLQLSGLVIKDLDHLLDALQEDLLPRYQEKEGVTVEQLEALPAQPEVPPHRRSKAYQQDAECGLELP